MIATSVRPTDGPVAFNLNCFQIGKSCPLLQLALVKYVFEVLAYGGHSHTKHIRHLALSGPKRTVTPGQLDGYPAISGVDQQGVSAVSLQKANALISCWHCPPQFSGIGLGKPLQRLSKIYIKLERLPVSPLA